MSEPLKICIQRATTRQEWDAMQDDSLNRAVAAADRIEKLEAALREIAALGYWDGDSAISIASKALEGKDE